MRSLKKQQQGYDSTRKYKMPVVNPFNQSRDDIEDLAREDFTTPYMGSEMANAQMSKGKHDALR